MQREKEKYQFSFFIIYFFQLRETNLDTVRRCEPNINVSRFSVNFNFEQKIYFYSDIDLRGF